MTLRHSLGEGKGEGGADVTPLAAFVLNPIICRRRLIATGLASVNCSSRFHHHGMAFRLCRRLVFHTFWNHIHFPFLDTHLSIMEVNGHFSAYNNEYLIGVLVVMPHKLTLKLHELEVAVVHLGNDLRGPVLGELGELFPKVDGALHLCSLSLAAKGGNQRRDLSAPSGLFHSAP